MGRGLSIGEQIVRRRRLWTALVVLACLALLWPASKLRLLTDLPALLPEGASAAEDYRVFLEHFGGFERAFVLLMGPAGEDSRQLLLPAAERLVEELADSAEVADVRAGLLQEDQDFFLQQAIRRTPLLIPDADISVLEQALSPEQLARRAAELKAQIHSPAAGPALQLDVHDPLGLWRRLDGLLAMDSGLPVDPMTSSFLSDDGEVALLVLTPSAGEIDAEGGRRLQAELDRRLADLRQDFPGLRTAALGGPLYAAHDEQLIRGDLERTLTGSAIACSLILFLAFGGPAIPVITLLCVAVALVAAAAALSLGLGSVTGIALGFAAVLVGLGVDYGIHAGTRYRQRRLAGDSAAGALDSAFRHAGPAILTAAMTTACAFAALGAAHFRPLREMGVVVAVGILAMVPAFGILGASLITWTSGAGSGSQRGGLVWRLLERGSQSCVAIARRRPKWVILGAVVLTVAAWPGVAGMTVNPDLRALRPENPQWREAETLLSEKLGMGLGTATVAIAGDDLEQALARAELAAGLIRQNRPDAQVVSPTDFWPAARSRQARLEVLGRLPLAQAADRLRSELVRQNVNPRAFASGLQAMATLGQGEDLPRPGAEEWPRSVQELITEDAFGRTWIALRVRFSTQPAGFSDSLLADLKQVSPQVAAASASRLGAEMKRLADRDFKALSWVALAMLTLVVGIAFRGRLAAVVLAFAPVLLGCFWLLGLWGAAGRSLDLLSLSVLPILLGIGIDDGLHGVHGALKPGRRRIVGLGDSVGSAGLAMTLTTVTTSAGFVGLAGSVIPGLANGGLLVAIGVWLCLLITLLLLPAIGELLDRNDGGE